MKIGYSSCEMRDVCSSQHELVTQITDLFASDFSITHSKNHNTNPKLTRTMSAHVLQAFNEYYNSEHSRSLNMWRDVVAVKRLYQDMQVSVRAEMSRMQNHIHAASRDVANAFGSVATNMRQTQLTDSAAQQQADRTNDDLRQQIGELRDHYSSAKSELLERDHRLQALLGDLKVFPTHWHMMSYHEM